jgi:hypothetical protein
MSESNRSGRALTLTLLVLAIIGVGCGYFYLKNSVDPLVELKQRIEQESGRWFVTCFVIH